MKKPILRLIQASLLAFAPALLADTSPNAITLNPADAAASALTLGGQTFPLQASGGFRLTDAATKADIPLPAGTVKAEDGKSVFSAENTSIRIKATFTPQKDYILVSGFLENLEGKDRGFLLDYRLPLQFPKATFSSDLTQNLTIDGDTTYESNLFPLGALSGPDGGVAIAIPPTDPRVFGLLGDTKGLAIRFYVGTTPKTKLFPNKAPFSFVIYRTEGDWGFRSALSQYYRFFPDYYTPRLKKDGIYMFQMGGRTPENIDQYGYNLFETQLPSLREALARDQAHSITTFPYMIVGQREIKYLPSLPQTYESAMEIYKKWTPADHSVYALCKENACALGDIHLKQEVENSAVGTSDGQYNIVIRNTLWGANSISFKINPNPYLFEGEGRKTVGADALELTDQWLKDHPEYGGMFIDSLGANWPAVLNYREDHFPYARYPLTVDPDGRVALDNAVSHYEYIEVLRKKMRETDRLLNGNGVYAYFSKKPKGKGAVESQVIDPKKSEFMAKNAPPEIYNPGTKVSRFFCAALLDVASCEFGSRATVVQSQDNRVLMGRKQFSYLNYNWEDQAKVEEFINKSLAFGIFASNTTNFFTGEIYESSLRGYLRDKPLIDWFVPLVRTISRAGWEPVRYAEIAGEGLSGERYGHGNTAYFTVYNDSETKQNATITLDLKSLGLKSDDVKIREIARSTPLEIEGGKVTLPVDSKKTAILEVTTGAKTAAN